MWRSDDGEGSVTESVLSLEDLGSPEIDELEESVLVDHEVLRLHVTEDCGLVVEVLEDEDHGGNVELGVVGVEETDITDDVEQLHTLDVLDEEVDVVGVLEGTGVVDDEGEVDEFEDSLLLDDVLFE